MKTTNELIEVLIQDSAKSLSDDEIALLLNLTADEIAGLAEQAGEAADYAIEALVEEASTRDPLLTSLASRIKDYWLVLEDVPGGTPFEIAVRCAEFLAKALRLQGAPLSQIQGLAQSAEWQDRLVAAWYVREDGREEAVLIKNLLKEDTFQDDNGLFLVREGAGFYES
jgi:hypothetical protein